MVITEQKKRRDYNPNWTLVPLY